MVNIKNNILLKAFLCFLLLWTGISCSSEEALQDTDNSKEEAKESDKDNQEEEGSLVLDSSQNLGVNYNGQLEFIDHEQLEELETTWVRGFVDFFRYYENPDLLGDEKLQSYNGLKASDFKTVLNIKWLFKNREFPQANSQEMSDQMAFLDRLLAKVWDNTDIIVVGNEPFIETDDKDKNEVMYSYYVEALNRVKEFAEENGERPIFFGAFDNMYLGNKQSLQVTKDLLEYSKATSWISGVDMHIHHSGTKQMQDALDFVSARIRDDQKILISEFSLMKHFRSKLSEVIPTDFAAEYGFSEDMQNYAYLDYALKNQVERKQWVDFLSQSYWFENRKYYLSNSFNDIFSKNDKFFLATYAIRQSFPFDKNYTANTDP